MVEPHTVEEYFSGSHFYDRTCLNEQWRVQGVRPSDELRACVTIAPLRSRILGPFLSRSVLSRAGGRQASSIG